MARYLIIGKSPHMEQIFLVENGRFVEKRISRGQKIEIDESQMNFHLRRRATRKAIQIIELDDEAPKAEPEEIKSTIVFDEPPIEKTPAVKIVEIDQEAPAKKESAKKKPKRRAKKKSETSES